MLGTKRRAARTRRNGDVDYENLPISSAAPVVNKILYLQREHLEATAAAAA